MNAGNDANKPESLFKSRDAAKPGRESAHSASARRRLPGSLLEFRYGFAVLMVTAAWVATSQFRLESPHRPLSLVFFFAAVVISAGYGGIGPGVLATTLAALLYDYFFLTPLHSIYVAPSDLPLLELFLLTAVFINVLSERLRAQTKELTAVKDALAALNEITAAGSLSLELATVTATLKEQIAARLQLPGGLLFVVQGAEDQRLLPAEKWGFAGAEAHVEVTWPAEPLAQLRGPEQETFAARSGAVCALPFSISPPESIPPTWKAYLLVPLVAAGELQGILCLFDTSALRFNQAGRAFYETLGRQTGVFIQNARLYGQVRTGRERLESVSRQLVRAQEAERREIARELHDEVGQTLTGLELSLERSLRLSPEALRGNLQQALALIGELMAQVRHLSLDLRPAMLDDLGLLPTLLWYFERYTALTGVRVHFEHNEPARRFSQEVETTVYRIIQEALTNVARYAGTEDATVRFLDAADLLVVQVTDKGCGFDKETPLRAGGTGGLSGMSERAALLDGRLTIESAPGEGTSLTAELPVPTEEDGRKEIE